MASSPVTPADQDRRVRVGIAHHYGWAVAVTASADGAVVDRRSIELLEPGLPGAPIHHHGGAHAQHHSGDRLGDDELAELVTRVRASLARCAKAAFDGLAATLDAPIESVAVRTWPDDFPTDIRTLRRVPYESRADSVMYCHVLAEIAHARGWLVHRYDARTVEAHASRLLGRRADDVLVGPRRRLGPPWTKDHRQALAATIVHDATGHPSTG